MALLSGKLTPRIASINRLGSLQRQRAFEEISAKAQALEACRIRTIGRNELDAILERFPDAARRLLDLVGQRFFHVLTDLEGTLFFGLVSRTARLLLERADGNRIQNITHKEIAEHLHVYRESATQALGALRRAGIITVGRKEIRILHRDRLERAACE